MMLMLQPDPTANSRSRGFTFLEIMSVVVIIGILMGVAVPYVAGKVQQSRVQACALQIKNFSLALAGFESTVGRLPDESEGLQALIECPSSLEPDQWGGPYIDNDVVPEDPWKNEYRYRAPGERRIEYDVWSTGPDRQDGTPDDIGNWTKKSNS